jgi:hypothetical protein
MADVEQVIEIRDPEVNVEEIMARIRERIQQRRAQAAAQGVEYDRLTQVEKSDAPAGRLSVDTYYDLHQLRENADGILVSLAMRDRRFPIFNGILFRLEKLLHRLVIKYVNALAGRQVVFNQATGRILTNATRALDEDATRLQTLEKQIAELQERLAVLEKSSSERR